MYSRRPSEIAGVADEWAAYQFDLVVAQFGAWVEGKLNERDDKGKPKTTLAKLLGDKAQRQAAGASGMALPVTAIRKVRIKEDGTWDD